MLVTHEDKQLIEECLAAYRAQAEANFASAPANVRASLIERLGSFMPVRVPESVVATVLSTLPAPPPPLLVAYATTRSFTALDFGEYHLPAVAEQEPLRHVADLLRVTELWPAGYMQVASTVNGDPVCFDYRRPTADGDYPIVVFNHDWIPHDAWRARESLMPYAREVAPSFRAFFTTLCFDRERIPCS